LRQQESKNQSQQELISRLREEKAQFVALLKSEKEQFQKLNFDFIANQTLCTKIKEAISELNKKLVEGTYPNIGYNRC